MDRLHVFFLALAVRNREIAEQLGKVTRFKPDELRHIWLRYETEFDFSCLWRLVGTPGAPAPPRSYPEVAILIQELRSKYWSGPLRHRGRGRTLPPDPDAFCGIEDLAARFQIVRTDVWNPYKKKVDPKAWENGVAVRRLLDEERYSDEVDRLARGALNIAGVQLDLLREPASRDFLVARFNELPTRGSVTVALEVARGEYGYKGKYRTFYDAWRRAKSKSGADTRRRPV